MSQVLVLVLACPVLVNITGIFAAVALIVLVIYALFFFRAVSPNMQPIASARHLSTDYAVGVASVSNVTLPRGPCSVQTAPTTVAVYMANHSHVVSLPNRHLNTAPVLVIVCS